jgi:hypothetical protein
MAVPLQLVGAWRRSGLLLDGVRQVDYCDVIWLQTPEWFADIRLLIDPSVRVPTDGVPDFFFHQLAFAGVTGWDPPVVTWSHRLDSRPESAGDASPVTWEDGVMIERGRVPVGGGRHAVFAEEWLRMTDDDVVWWCGHGDTEARVEVGHFAVEIKDSRPHGGFLATRYSKIGSEWVEVGRVTA